MSDLLHIDASPRGAASESRRLADAFIEGFRAADPGAEVDRLDPFAADMPRFARAAAEAKMAVIGGGEPAGGADAAAWESALALARRVTGARTLLFGVPMWNAGIPWALKHLIDTITQPGVAFRFDPSTGYHGLLGGRRAVALYTSAVYSPGVPPAFGVDFHAAYLEYWLGFVGIDEVASVRLQPTFPGPDLDARRETALAEARALGQTEGARGRRAAA